MERHEIPTHLNVEDRIFGGLTMRQLMTAAIGLALAYGAASEPPLPAPVRLVSAAVVLIALALVVLVRPGGRPFEDWAFVLLRYWAAPRVAVWRPRTVATRHAEQQQPRHEVVLPDLAVARARYAKGEHRVAKR